MAKIQHIAIIAENPEKLAHFYEDIYGMKITGRSQGDVWITDGYMDVAIIHKDNLPDQPTGINHFGFTIDPEEKRRDLPENGRAQSGAVRSPCFES